MILSLAFELRPNLIPPHDVTGVSKLQLQSKKHPDEHECAVQLAESTSRIENVDLHLESDKKLKEDLTKTAATLLGSAGYDQNAYKKWVEGGEVIKNQ